MRNSDQNQNFISFKQPEIKVIDAKIWNEYFTDERYFLIIRQLYKKPMTLSELHQQYHENLVESIEERGKKKSENTIYRYIQDLIKADIITVAGHQLTSSQVASKLLYSLSAKIILFANLNEYYLNSEDGPIIATLIGNILKIYYHNNRPKEDAIIEILKGIEVDQTRYRGEIISLLTSDETIYHGLISLNGKELYKFYSTLGVLQWLVSTDIQKFKSSLNSVYSNKKSESAHNNEIIDEKDDMTHIDDLKEQRKHHDHIMYHPINIHLIDANIKQRLENKFEFAVILKVLRGEQMTIKDIHSNFYNQWERSYEAFVKIKERLLQKRRIVRKDYPKPSSRSENTLYQYIQQLIEMNIIVECGRRMFPGQSTTQILYARKAAVFYYTAFDEAFWKFDNNPKISMLLLKCIAHHNDQSVNISKMNFGSLHKLILDFSSYTEKNIKLLLEDLPNDINIEAISTFTLYESRVFNSLFGLMVGIHSTKSENMINALKTKVQQ